MHASLNLLGCWKGLSILAFGNGRTCRFRASRYRRASPKPKAKAGRSTSTTACPDMAKKGSPDDANPGAERSAAPFVPKTTSLRVLGAAAQKCRGCDLYKTATQVVFGAGPARARVVFVGEQPGDQEDLQGAPFVGPAGAMLDKALADAGIPRGEVYLTNAVKHFKWEPRGKRRIHKKPRVSEMKACRPWLEAELRVVKPQIIVC